MAKDIKWSASKQMFIHKKERLENSEVGLSHLIGLGNMTNWAIKYDDVQKVAISSRIIVFCLQLLAREFVPIHRNDGFKFLDDENEKQGLVDKIVRYLFGGFISWDGQYFLHITTFGYNEENTMAFFPLLPLIIRGIASIVYFLLPVISYTSFAILVSWFVNTWLFVMSTKCLYRLVPYLDVGLENLRSLVVILFCFNPASIFFSGFYTESLFCYLTIQVLLNLFEKKRLKALMFASLSSICRSNGLLNFGFIGAYYLRDALRELEADKGRSFSEKYLRTVGFLIVQSGKIAVGLLPFFIFQEFCRRRFCLEEYDLISEVPEFCKGFGSQLPYQYIQSKNWNVGFLSYFECKQIPNFLLAAPVLYVLGQQCIPRLLRHIKCAIKERNVRYLPTIALCGHGAFLSVICLTCIHVQVSTRLILSACPYLYIFIAKSIRTELLRFRTGSIQLLLYTLSIYSWFFLYFLLGSIAFPTGYPWT